MYDARSSLVIDSLESSRAMGQSPFAYIYCDYNNHQGQTPLLLVSSLLEQLLRRLGNASLPAEVSTLYASHRKHDTRPKLEQLTDVFRKITSQFTSIHIVIDALDECASSDTLALKVVKAICALGPDIRILCTSRLSTIFDAFFSEATRIDILAHDEDLRMFLEARMGQESRLSRHIRKDPRLVDEIVRTIISQSRGM